MTIPNFPNPFGLGINPGLFGGGLGSYCPACGYGFPEQQQNSLFDVALQKEYVELIQAQQTKNMLNLAALSLHNKLLHCYVYAYYEPWEKPPDWNPRRLICLDDYTKPFLPEVKKKPSFWKRVLR